MSEPQASEASHGMQTFRKKPVEIRAVQWFKNGDHPDDHPDGRDPEWEGMAVRYFRRPDVSGKDVCAQCSQGMHDHGWIDTLEGGHTVCPGDWIITGVELSLIHI